MELTLFILLVFWGFFACWFGFFCHATFTIRFFADYELAIIIAKQVAKSGG